jgi:segregation and condensation protein B
VTDALIRQSTRLPLADMAPVELQELLIALLLVAPAPTTVIELAAGADVEPTAVEAALVDLDQRTSGGWLIQRHGEQIQLVTAPRFANQVRRFLGLDREARLSPAALESLAIIAYQQPVTRPEIESVRGVDCSGVLATLMQRGLVEQVGRLQSPGQPIQYGTTPGFLHLFGISALAELPPIGEIGGVSGADRLTALVAAVEVEGPAPSPLGRPTGSRQGCGYG